MCKDNKNYQITIPHEIFGPNLAEPWEGESKGEIKQGSDRGHEYTHDIY